MDPAPYGGNLPQAIGAAVASCDVLILMIGPHWMAVTGEGLHDPNDYVRLAMEAALARGIMVVPVTVDGARMPVHGELPPSLASMAGQPAFQISMSNFDAESGQLLRILDQSITERQATQLAPSPGASTFPGPQAAVDAGSRAAAVLDQAPAAAAALRDPGHRLVRGRGRRHRGGRVLRLPDPRRPPRSVVVRGVIRVVVGLRGVLAARQYRAQGHLLGLLGGSGANVILADDFSSQKTGWTDDAHQAAGAYTGSTYRLSVTGANGVSEIARPMNATHGLAEMTPLNLSATVDVHKLSGAPQGYGLGIAIRSNGGGDVYAFLVEDHAVAIQKWTGGGAVVSDSPDPVPATLNPSAPDRLRAVCQTIDGGQAVHLELWLNGKKMVDYTDHDHPYTKGYMGLYVESISDASSTAGAEFDNFSASQL